MKRSEPLAVLPGGGQLAKPLKDCTELSLARRGITKLAGFDRLPNLEVLWLNHNSLTALTHLDANSRLQQLYVHSNKLVTLKGSLPKLKFLTHLDLSCNKLKHLGKVLDSLQKLRFLRELNLQGNQCCEEPQYRLTVLAALPGLMVLDLHEVTTLERQQAARLTAGGHVKPPAVAFGAHLPEMSHTAARAAALQAAATAATAAGASAHTQQQQQQQQQCRKQKNYSVLEQELEEEVEAIRQKRQDAAAAAEAALYARNPDAAYWEHRSSLPPSPGLIQAQQTWATATAAAAAAATARRSSSGGGSGGGGLLGHQTGAHMALTAAGGVTIGSGSSSREELETRGCLQGTFSYRTGGPCAQAINSRG